MGERRFSDEEVGQILSRAAANQAGRHEPVSSDGITLAELVKVAGEVGFLPEQIQRAASEVEFSRRARSGPDQSSVLLEQTIHGEIDEAAWGEMVTNAQVLSGVNGQISSAGSAWEWNGESRAFNLSVRAIRRNQQTQIKVLGNRSRGDTTLTAMGFIAAMYSCIIVAVASVKMLPSVNPFVMTGVALAVAISCVMVMTHLKRKRRAEFRAQIESLLDGMTKTANAATTLPQSGVQTESTGSDQELRLR